MSIVTVELLKAESDTATYRGQDDQGVWHVYGPCAIEPGVTSPATYNIATKLENLLKKREVSVWLRGDITVSDLENVTGAEIATIIRNRYRSLKKSQLIRLSRRIYDGVLAAEFTEQQLINAFGVTNTYWTTTLRPKIIAQATLYDDVESAEGE